ncbi:hypothetical protein N9S92_01025 [Candidatus Pelagibacter sp.]|nr:hypothetical protein [Candidatus Pelagibacter sp.]
MKKIITAIAFIALSTVSAKAVDLGMFSITAGIASNTGVYGATGVQTNEDGDGGTFRTNQDSGVFTDGHSSQFIELGLGQYFSVGYEVSPDSISTPTNTTREGEGTETKVQVDFNDLTTTYVKLELPAGVYARYGEVETDLDIKETMTSGSTYKNVSTSGTLAALGYSKKFGESGLAIRVEGAYLELDAVKTDNGIAKGTVNIASGSVNFNQVEAKNMEGLQGKIALTFTLGGNN